MKVELVRIREKRREISYIRDRIDLLREVVPKVSKTSDEFRGTGGHRGLDDVIIRLDDLCEEYGRCLELYARECDKIQACLRDKLSLMEMQAIEYYYLHAKTWSEVASMMNVSISYVFKLHRRALGKLGSVV